MIYNKYKIYYYIIILSFNYFIILLVKITNKICIFFLFIYIKK